MAVINKTTYSPKVVLHQQSLLTRGKKKKGSHGLVTIVKCENQIYKLKLKLQIHNGRHRKISNYSEKVTS